MKTYQQTIVFDQRCREGDFVRNIVTTEKTGQQQGKELWDSHPNAFLVQVQPFEYYDDECDEDYYIRNVR